MRIIGAILVVFLGVSVSCSPVSKSRLTKTFRATDSEFQDHTGFMLFDLKGNKEMFSYHADRYFTPASNTKIFALYSGLKILGDSVPALKYAVAGDSLIIWGTGDPSLLYDKVGTNQHVIDFLRNTSKQIYFSADNFFTSHFGPGWAWDDYPYAYSSERSPLPIYGNRIKIAQTDGGYVKLTPGIFRKNIWLADSVKQLSLFIRETGGNRIEFFPGSLAVSEEKAIPFRCDPLLISEMLADTIGLPVRLIHAPMRKDARILHSLPSDSLYGVMMQESDNFIAEQILLMCSDVLSDSLNPDITIREMKRRHLYDMPDKLVWVDGSGLSRYNLFTPRSIVQLWKKIHEMIPQDRLFSLVAIGGRKGTIKNYFRSEKPYIFGKTGTLSNNHSLSGFMVAKSGRVLIFSFMNSNYTIPASRVRSRMEEILNTIYENY